MCQGRIDAFYTCKAARVRKLEYNYHPKEISKNFPDQGNFDLRVMADSYGFYERLMTEN